MPVICPQCRGKGHINSRRDLVYLKPGKLRELRERARLNHYILAELAGLNPNYIWRLERKSRCREQTVRNLVLALGCEREDLVDTP